MLSYVIMSACSSSWVCLLSCVCVFDDVYVCVCVFHDVCVCVFLWLAPASLPPFPIRPHGSLPLVCLQRLHLSKKEKKGKYWSNHLSLLCLCIMTGCMHACLWVFIYLRTCAPLTQQSCFHTEDYVTYSVWGSHHRYPNGSWGLREKNTVFDHVTHLISTLLYLSLCWNELRLDDLDKEPMIDTKII